MNPRAIARAACKVNSDQKTNQRSLWRFHAEISPNSRPAERRREAATEANHVGRPLQAGSSELLKSTNEEDPCQRQRHPHGTPHSGYGTTPVGCRGGNRYVEGEPRTFG